MSVSVPRQNVTVNGVLKRNKTVYADDKGSSRGYIKIKTRNGMQDIRVRKVSTNHWQNS